MRPSQPYFWLTYSGAELDLFFLHRGYRYGVEFKFIEAPKVTKSIRIAVKDLALRHLWVIYPGQHHYPVDKSITVWPLQQLSDLPAQLT